MYKIVKKREITSNIKMFEVYAPAIAKKAKPGQFVIVRTTDMGERFPITIAGTNPYEGTVCIYFAEVGKSSIELGKFSEGDQIPTFAGPLGNATEIKRYGKTLCVGGGVFVGAMLYMIKAFKTTGNEVIAVWGARNKDQLILVDEVKSIADEAYICTDDGSEEFKGIDIINTLLMKYDFDHVFIIGPTSLQKNIVEITRPFRIPTKVNLFPIMVDGMGMCGACRVTVAGDTRFSCVDGPEFNGHEVDFDELLMRMRVYNPQEKIAMVVENREAV